MEAFVLEKSIFSASAKGKNSLFDPLFTNILVSDYHPCTLVWESQLSLYYISRHIDIIGFFVLDT